MDSDVYNILKLRRSKMLVAIVAIERSSVGAKPWCRSYGVSFV